MAESEQTRAIEANAGRARRRAGMRLAILAMVLLAAVAGLSAAPREAKPAKQLDLFPRNKESEPGKFDPSTAYLRMYSHSNPYLKIKRVRRGPDSKPFDPLAALQESRAARLAGLKSQNEKAAQETRYSARPVLKPTPRYKLPGTITPLGQ